MNESDNNDAGNVDFHALRKRVKHYASQAKWGLKSPRFDSSDVAQLACIQVWQAWQSVEDAGVEHLVTNGHYLRKVCFGQTVNLLRFHGAHKRSPARESQGSVDDVSNMQSPLEELAQREDLQSLTTAISQLDEDDRRLILMRFVQSMTFEEMASELNRSINWVYRHVKSSLAELSKILSAKD